MLNYVRAELYKATHRKYLYIFLAIVLGLEALFLGFSAYFNAAGDWLLLDLTTALMMGMPLLTIGIYLSVIIADLVFSDQYKYGTLKNEISFGINRTRVYLGKLITGMLVGTVLVAVLLVFYILLGALLLPKGPETLAMLCQLGSAALMAWPLYLGALGFIFLFFVNIKNNTLASLFPTLTLAALGPILGNLMNYRQALPPAVGAIATAVYPILLTTPFDQLSAAPITPDFLLRAWAIGLGWLVVTTVIGVALFRKREIN